MKVIKATLHNPKAHIAIVVARFNNFINNSLLDSAIDALTRLGQVKDENITVIWVPGAYELPITVNILANTGKYDAIIALGTIIRGDTGHFKYISNESSSGLAMASINNNIPVAFGVLTTENIEQAIERAGTKSGNKGNAAALTALEMINVLQAIKDKF